MNTYVEHMCVNICIYMFPLLGETCLKPGILTTYLGNLEICWASLPLLRRGKRKRKLQQLRF